MSFSSIWLQACGVLTYFSFFSVQDVVGNGVTIHIKKSAQKTNETYQVGLF